MIGIRLVRRLRWWAAVAGAGLLWFAGDAQAGAILTPFESHEVLSGTTSLPECLPADLVGVVSGTEDTIGTFVETGGTLHFRATSALRYRVEFPDGSYVIGSATEHLAFSSIRADNPAVLTHVGVEPRTVYDAMGNKIGSAVLHFREHVTVFDANRNGVLDPGEIVTSTEDFRFTCH
jgi:hypothetical protein